MNHNLFVSRATAGDALVWDEYLMGHFARYPELAHHAFYFAWSSVITATFGHKPFFLIAREQEGGAIQGLLPLFLVKSPLFGTALISNPYLNAGGMLADSPEVAQLLVQFVERLAAEEKVDYVELRVREAGSVCPAGWSVRSHKLTMALPLRADPEELFESFPAKLRSQIRRPAKAGLRVTSLTPQPGENDRECLEALEQFYGVFARHMRDLGTPVYSRRLFSNSAAALGTKLRIFIVWSGAIPVAASITIGAGKSLEVPWACALRKYNQHSPNMLLYWEMMKQACADGYQTFDFGRSTPGSGPHKFKQQWGANEHPLFWVYKLQHGEIPDVNPKSLKFSTLVRVWQRLPVPIANFLGPLITRGLP